MYDQLRFAWNRLIWKLGLVNMNGIIACYEVKVVAARQCSQVASPCFDLWSFITIGKL